MAYWWVNQGSSFNLEFKGGFIWAPIINAKEQSFFYWQNVAEVKEGDIIFSNVDGKIKAVGIALNDAYPAEKSSDHANIWLSEGQRADLKYFLTPHIVTVSQIYAATSSFWPNKYSPIGRSGDRANQGYLFSVPDTAGDVILKMSGNSEIANTNPSKKPTSETTKDAIIKARVGQGIFRKDLIKRWSGKCAITHFPILSLLVASHIKPWAISNNEERLDPDNGLLLSPNYNSLFDKFLISFAEDGNLIKSNRVTWEDLALLNISSDAKLTDLTKRNVSFLKEHLHIMNQKQL